MVLVDVHMPGGGGPEVIRQVAGPRPAVRFLALSVSDSADDVIEAIRAGARGYVTKTISTAELVDALATVAAGDAVFSPRLAGFVLDAFGGGPAPSTLHLDPELDQLTREREVLRLIAEGRSNREIGAALFISVKTASVHVSNIMAKLGVASRTEAAAMALRDGIARSA